MPIGPHRDNKVFYGWHIAGMAFVAHFMATGTGFYLFNVFMKPLCELRGWSRTEINMALMIGPFMGLIGQLIYGTLVVRTGPRIIMAIGPIFGCVSFVLMGRVLEIWQFYLLYIALCFSNGAMSGIVATTAVNNWFEKKRGAALGFATAGISLSGALLPFVALFMLERSDLPNVYFKIGIMILLVSPLSAIVIRNWPEEHGLRPDGIIPSPAEMNEPIDEAKESYTPKWTLSKLIRVPAFWKLGFAYAFILTGISGVMSQLVPRFSDIGFGDRAAVTMMSATALMGTFGKFFWGWLCDHFEPRYVIATLMTGGALGLCFILTSGSLPALFAFIIIYGFAMGGVLSTSPVMIAHLFGRLSFPTVAKFLALISVIHGVGPIAMGQSFDRMGSYNPAYILFIVLNFAAAAIILSIKRVDSGQ